MNEPLEKTDAGATTGAGPSPALAPVVPEKPAGVPPAGDGAKKSVAQFGGNPTGRAPKAGFKFPANTPQGKQERRDADAERKRAEREAAAKAAVPAALPSAVSGPGVPGPGQAPAGEQMPGVGAPVAAVVVEFVPWVAADVADFTDELVELAEVKRVTDFVTVAREAQMPAKFVAEVEKRSHYPVNSKNALKRTLAECAAKWLNKTGVSSANKEEVKLLFCLVTVKLQGVRLKRDLLAMIEDDKAKRVEKPKQETKPETAKPQPGSEPALSIVN